MMKKSYNDKISTIDMECTIADYFNPRVNLIVPNVSWGLGVHEMDLMIVTKKNYIYEVEIKINKWDLKYDILKSHGHKNKLVKYLYFAIPENMIANINLIPENAGVLIVSRVKLETGWHLKVQSFRSPLVNSDCIKITEAQRYQIARLGAMRIWTLKEKIRRNKCQ